MMRLSYVVLCLVISRLTGLGMPDAKADPCGMVPPIDWADQTPIKRIGVQMTYVFYQNHLETIVLRPGFSGSVDEFGMLIPFPSPPAIRKVPDNVFEQIAAAIDPPEVVIDLRPRQAMYGGGGFGGGLGGGGGFGGGLEFQLSNDEVRVIREEAVGMYEVAVLAAGSAHALKRWMEDHRFAYPSGMDAVCSEYIRQDWCFVAVKTKVNQKQAADPQPSQRVIRNDLPAGASFDGHVQAMGFRFHTPRLVVPMRLSVHNPGELRNVVYLLSDRPSKIRNIPETYVRRQISGFKLFDQLTKPLPLRILGGTINDIPRSTRLGLANRRDPGPHNGVAAELFASDLMAARSGQLESRSEAYEKHLLTINEALELRGPAIDAAVRRQIRGERARIVRAALKAIDRMTLTVIDGDFPREILAREDLTFAEYHMPLERSNRRFYDANKLGRTERRPGSLHLGSVESPNEPQVRQPDFNGNEEISPPVNQARWSWLAIVVSVTVVGYIVLPVPPARRRTVIVIGRQGRSQCELPLGRLQPAPVGRWTRVRKTTHPLIIDIGRQGRSQCELPLGRLQPAPVGRWTRVRKTTHPLIIGIGSALIIVSTSLLAFGDSDEKIPALNILVKRLGNPDTAEAASEQIAKLGEAAVPALIHQSRSRNLIAQGWAIVSLGRIGGDDAMQQLRRLQSHESVPPLVQIWAAAAILRAARTSEELEEMSQVVSRRPELARPFVVAVQRQLRVSEGTDALETLLVAASRSQVLAVSLGPELISGGVEPLLRAMLRSDDPIVRRAAAGYVATIGRQAGRSRSVATRVVAALKFDPFAEQSPWHEGALFIPSIPWQAGEARALVGNLMRWHLWAERRDTPGVRRQIDTNLRSITLATAAGYRIPKLSNTEAWLKSWKRVVGSNELKLLLAEQGAEGDYAELLMD